MSKYGLQKNATFESLLDNGREYDFSDVHVYNRAAVNFRNSFFGAPEPIQDLVDHTHDDKHEAVLAKMKAMAMEVERKQTAHMEQARQVYRQNAMPQHHAAHETPNMLDEPLSFVKKMERRQEGYALNRNPYYEARKDLNRLRQEARQKVERNISLQTKRGPSPQEFNGPPPSPRLQEKTDKRLLTQMAKRNPTVPKPEGPKTKSTLFSKRESAFQIARKRTEREEARPRPQASRVRRKTGPTT